MTEAERAWWHGIQWTDVVFIVLGVVLLLILKMELWLPHYGPE
jgi:hypothetical protein